MLFYIGASVIIAMGFGAFTSKLRRPYIVIFTGLSLAGLAYFELSALAALGQLNAAIYGTLIVAPFIVSAMLTFAGTRMLAKAFGVRNIAMRWWFAIGIIVAASVLLAVMPHASSPTPESEFDFANALNIWAIVLFGLGAYHVLRIKRHSSVAFINPLAWLSLSLFTTSVLAGGGSTLMVMAVGGASDQAILLAALVPSCFAAVLFLRSAYSFNKIVYSTDTAGLSVARNFFGKPLESLTETSTTSVDIVMYTAGLVSNPSEIDPLLEHVRLVTSHLQNGQQIAEQDEQTLMNVYLQVEDYLLNKESLRVFTKDSLRQDVAQKLRLTAGTVGTFWPKLNQSYSTPQA